MRGGHRIGEIQQNLTWAGPPFGKDRIPKTLGWNALLVLAALTQISWPLSEFSCGIEAPVYMHKHGWTAQLYNICKVSDKQLRPLGV